MAQAAAEGKSWKLPASPVTGGDGSSSPGLPRAAGHRQKRRRAGKQEGQLLSRWHQESCHSPSVSSTGTRAPEAAGAAVGVCLTGAKTGQAGEAAQKGLKPGFHPPHKLSQKSRRKRIGTCQPFWEETGIVGGERLAGAGGKDVPQCPRYALPPFPLLLGCAMEPTFTPPPSALSPHAPPVCPSQGGGWDGRVAEP